MKLLTLLTLVFPATVLPARVTDPRKVSRDAVLLSRVSAITVRAGKPTTSRRVAPVPQLQCVGPSQICKLYSVDVMRCTNEGADYDENNVQWSCKASLPEEFKLGSTDVMCEGYESSEDPYVLKGSCGVQYRLLLTEKGEEKYATRSHFNLGEYGKENPAEKYAGYLFMALFLLVLFIILRGLYNAWRNDTATRRRPRPRGRDFFGGGGGDGGDDDPPPPYDPRPPRPKKTSGGSSTRSNYGSGMGGVPEQGWRPGFWTGTAAGAAAAYFAGRGGRTRTEPAPPTIPPPTTRGWFGGGETTPGSSPPSPPRAPRSSSSYSSSRHESTGFGGTSRR